MRSDDPQCCARRTGARSGRGPDRLGALGRPLSGGARVWLLTVPAAVCALTGLLLAGWCVVAGIWFLAGWPGGLAAAAGLFICAAHYLRRDAPSVAWVTAGIGLLLGVMTAWVVALLGSWIFHYA